MSCLYCEKGDKLRGFAIEICQLKSTILYLFKEQSYTGRCVLVLKRHAEEVFELTGQEKEGFIEDLCLATEAIHEIFKPDKINCGIYGDTVKHLHIHIVPKYDGQLDWNSTFQMNPNKNYLSENEYAQITEKIKTYMTSKQ